MEPQEPEATSGAPLSPEFAGSVFPHPTQTGRPAMSAWPPPPTLDPTGKAMHDAQVTDPQAPAAPRGALKRVLTRDVPKPPFAGKKLGRSEVERLLQIAADTGRRGRIDLRGADLRGADLTGLDLGGVMLGDDDPLANEEERREMAAHLDLALLGNANLNGAVAPGATFEGADLRGAHLHGANLSGASFVGARLQKADLGDARLTEAKLPDAHLSGAMLQGAVLVGAQMQRARLDGARLEGADFGLANLAGADLRQAYCDEQTYLGGSLLQGAAFDGLRLRDVDLTATDWSAVESLGEEREARQAPANLQATAFRLAARTYRRLGLALRMQGMSDDGQRLLARARRMEERALYAALRERWRERAIWPTMHAARRWSGAAIQGITSGYGAHPARAIGWALGVFVCGALLNIWLLPGHPNLSASLVISGANLFGHGYFALPGALSRPDWPSVIAISEAALGTLLFLLFALGLARKTIE